MRSGKSDGRQLRFGADKIRLPAAGPGLLYFPNEEARKPWGTKTGARQDIALCRDLRCTQARQIGSFAGGAVSSRPLDPARHSAQKPMNKSLSLFKPPFFRYAESRKKEAWFMDIRLADAQDFALLAKYDQHISPEELRRKLDRSEVMIATDNGIFAGWMRWNFFWDEIPFLNMLYLLEPYRGKGHGRAMMNAWENRMRAEGHERVMTSTQTDECAQFFYRKLGYVGIGAFACPGDELELILYKAL